MVEPLHAVPALVPVLRAHGLPLVAVRALAAVTLHLHGYNGTIYISLSLLRGAKSEYMLFMCKGYDVSKPDSNVVGGAEPPKLHETAITLAVKTKTEKWVSRRIGHRFRV